MDMKRLDWIIAKAGEAATLTPWELNFMASISARRERYKDKIMISEKQEEVLERIADKD